MANKMGIEVGAELTGDFALSRPEDDADGLP